MTKLLNPLRPNAFLLRLWPQQDGFSAVVIVLASGETFEFATLEGLQAFIQGQVQSLTLANTDDPRR